MQAAQIKNLLLFQLKELKQDLSCYPLQAKQNLQFVSNQVNFLLNKSIGTLQRNKTESRDSKTTFINAKHTI